MSKLKQIQKEEFLALVEKNRGIIVKISKIYSETEYYRNDLIGEIILQLWKSYPNFKGNSKVTTWIYRVALNTALNTQRKKAQYSFLTFSSEDLSTHPDYLEEKDDAPWMDILYDIVNELDEYSKGIVLLYLDGSSHAEIASIMGLSVTNVGTRIHRIKQQLKTIISNNNY